MHICSNLMMIKNARAELGSALAFFCWLIQIQYLLINLVLGNATVVGGSFDGVIFTHALRHVGGDVLGDCHVLPKAACCIG